ncbi:MAG: sugar kinase [Phycisphaeraceae bacterium]|nr:sugar kinase [Phycisphaeraceae bacterium]
MPLICTGTIGIDTVFAPAGHAERVLGGSCTYFCAAASFFSPVRMVAAVGGDFPSEFRDVLSSFAGVDLRGLETRPNSKTFAWGGKYLQNMNTRETLFTELGVLAEHPPTVPEAFADSRYVFLANSHPAVQLNLLSQIRGKPTVVADTMDLWINTAKADLLVLLRKTDGLVLNYDEAELLTGRSNSVAAARHILEMGPRFVVVKKGEHGALLAHRDGLAALPAFPAEFVVDPTGAGDTFAGGMMGWIASTNAPDPASFDTIRRSLAAGTVVASFNIESFSLDRLRTLTRSELDTRIRQYADMVRIP